MTWERTGRGEDAGKLQVLGYSHLYFSPERPLERSQAPGGEEEEGAWWFETQKLQMRGGNRILERANGSTPAGYRPQLLENGRWKQGCASHHVHQLSWDTGLVYLAVKAQRPR